MDRFLFTDGMNGVQEVQSQEELQNLIESAGQSDRIRIWLFSTNEWISYANFRKKVPAVIKMEKMAIAVNGKPSIPNEKPAKGKGWLKKVLYITVAAAGIFLIFNFTKTLIAFI